MFLFLLKSDGGWNVSRKRRHFCHVGLYGIYRNRYCVQQRSNHLRRSDTNHFTLCGRAFLFQEDQKEIVLQVFSNRTGEQFFVLVDRNVRADYAVKKKKRESVCGIYRGCAPCICIYAAGMIENSKLLESSFRTHLSSCLPGFPLESSKCNRCSTLAFMYA